MKHVTLLGAFVAFGLSALNAGCSGSATTDGPGGSLGGGGNAGTSAGAGDAGKSGGGVGGSGVGGSGTAGGAGAPSGGSAGKGGGTGGASSVCMDGEKMMRDCNGCQCIQGQWACTLSACPIKNCGGFLGETCSATEYCAYTVGQACGAADASSTCKARPTACDDVYMPVCGCDQKTYPNSCEAAAQGQGVYSAGTCPIVEN